MCWGLRCSPDFLLLRTSASGSWDLNTHMDTVLEEMTIRSWSRQRSSHSRNGSGLLNGWEPPSARTCWTILLFCFRTQSFHFFDIFSSSFRFRVFVCVFIFDGVFFFKHISFEKIVENSFFERQMFVCFGRFEISVSLIRRRKGIVRSVS